MKNLVIILLATLTLLGCKDDEKVTTFTVTFDSKDGTPTPAIQKVIEGGMVKKPVDPILTNHQFTGWTTADDETGSFWDFSTETVTTDMTLYAKWQQTRLEVNGCSVTVCGGENGTACITSVESYVWGDGITLTATAKSGYRFVEWQVIEDDITLSSIIDNPALLYISNENGNRTAEVKAIFVPLVVLPETILRQDWEQKQIKYNYDSQNRITYCVIHRSIYLSFALDYNADGNLVGYSRRDSGSPSSRGTGATFSQNDNIITFTISYHPSVHLFGTVNGELELNAQGLPVKLTYKEESKQGPSWVFTGTTTHAVVSLTWQNENLTKKEWESESIIESIIQERYDSEIESVITKSSTVGTVTYTHDNKKTPFYHCNTPKWVLWWLDYYLVHVPNLNYEYNKNNIKTETREGSTTTYEYTYNSDGFPVTRTWGTTGEWDAGTITEMYTYY